VSGTDSDGVITLVAAFLRAGLTPWGFAGEPSCVPLIAAAVVAALVGLVAAIDLADVAGRIAHADAGDAPVSASVGIGLWLVLLRAIARVAVCDLKLAKADGPLRINTSSDAFWRRLVESCSTRP
jgi:hypothetical protein